MFDRRAPYIVQTLFYTSFVYLSAVDSTTKVRARCLKRNFLREKSERALQLVCQGNKDGVDFATSSMFSENALISKRTVYRNFEEGVYNLAVLRSDGGLSRIIRVEDSGGQEKGRKGDGRQRKRIGTGLITLKILYTDKLAASPCR